MPSTPAAPQLPRLKTFTHAVQSNNKFVRVEFLAKDGTTFKCVLSLQDCADIIQDLAGAAKQLAKHVAENAGED